jgi:hypothetical protein
MDNGAHSHLVDDVQQVDQGNFCVYSEGSSFSGADTPIGNPDWPFYDHYPDSFYPINEPSLVPVPYNPHSASSMGFQGPSTNSTTSSTWGTWGTTQSYTPSQYSIMTRTLNPNAHSPGQNTWSLPQSQTHNNSSGHSFYPNDIPFSTYSAPTGLWGTEAEPGCTNPSVNLGCVPPYNGQPAYGQAPPCLEPFPLSSVSMLIHNLKPAPILVVSPPLLSIVS